MRKLLVFALVVLSGLSFAQYPRNGVRLLSHVDLDQFPGSPTSGAAIYGYTSPSGREYATMGVRNGTAIVEVTNPSVPIIRAHIPGPSSLWHENVVLGDFCYSVTEGGNGIQIIDLRNIDLGVATLVATYTGNGLDNIHTIQADPSTNRLFVNGSNRGFLVLDATNPTALVEIGRWTTKYVHDCVVRNFTSGPYAGKQIGFFFCGISGLYIVDLSNPETLVDRGSLNYYPEAQVNFYCHSGALTPDGRYLMVNDEFDENRSLTPSCTTVVVDVANLDAPAVAHRFASGINTIDHNSHLRDGYLFLSAYKAGMRVYNAANPLALNEVGFFDSYPTSTNANSYDGNWGVYAGFASGNVVISDINSGLFVLDPSESIGKGAPLTGVTSLYGLVSGTIADLRYADDRRLEIQRTARYDFTVLAETTKTARSRVDLAIKGKGTGRFDVLLKNKTTGQFDAVGVMGMTQLERTVTFPNLAAANYVTSSGQIEVRVRSQGNPPATARVLDLDMVRATFHN
jgi:choice-of-anchor B domain-containing protein